MQAKETPVLEATNIGRLLQLLNASRFCNEPNKRKHSEQFSVALQSVRCCGRYAYKESIVKLEQKIPPLILVGIFAALMFYNRATIWLFEFFIYI